MHRAVGVEGVSRDGKYDGDGHREERAPALAFSGFRRNEVAPAAVTSVESSGWCSVSPENGVLFPGEQLELQLTALVGVQTPTKVVGAFQAV